MAGVTTIHIDGECAVEYRSQVFYDLVHPLEQLQDAIQREELAPIREKLSELHDGLNELDALGSWGAGGPEQPVEVVADTDQLSKRLERTLEKATDGCGWSQNDLRLVAWAAELLERLDRESEAVAV